MPTKRVFGGQKDNGNILSQYLNAGNAEAKDLNTLREEQKQMNPRKMQMAQKRNSSNIGGIVFGTGSEADFKERITGGSMSSRYQKSTLIKYQDSMSGVI